MKTMKLLTLTPFITLFIVSFCACNNLNDSKIPTNKADTNTYITQTNIVSTSDTVQQIDSSIINADTATILGQHYTAFYRSDGSFFIIDSKEDTVFIDNQLWPEFEFEDFDKDGCKDIRVHHMTNTPNMQDLILFDKDTRKFKKVDDFYDYPTPEKIIGTKYYYSYHRSGCADMNWDSDLFYIENFKTFRIGNIAGRECNNIDEKDGIYINLVKDENVILKKILSIRTIDKYKDYKWGFIKDYWTKNYMSFVK